MKIRLPLGIENFAELRENDCYYVDKTGFIRELLGETFKVNLITRPRRFGKTLTMSMLAEFFDIRKDSKSVFEGLEITNDEELCEEWMNRWPVLFLSLKDVNGNEFETAYGLLQFVIASLCIEHAYLEGSRAVDAADQQCFQRLKSRTGDETDVQSALFVLTRMMAAYYGKPVILLIDEYDVPLAKASDNGYYGKMLNIIRSMLGMVWKTNPSLKFAVVTGCLRIAKENIFTGANNFVSNSISNDYYNNYFGFLEPEVRQLLGVIGGSESFDDLKKWYDGYLFGGKEVYCPWDVINHVRLMQRNPAVKPASYWRDTSHNGIIRKFIDIIGTAVTGKLETLLAGGVTQERIVEDLTYDIAHSSEENLWSILYLTGYLTQASPESWPEGFQLEDGKMPLRIPNEEVKTIFAETVANWFTDTVEAKDRTALFQAFWEGDDKKLTEEVTDLLFDTISYFDYKEDYYHAFVTGLFAGAGYEVWSNSEQGTGRTDVVVTDRRNRRAIIVEVKRSKTENRMEKDYAGAQKQIEREQYARKFLKGYETILCYGAAFFEKECRIRLIVKQGNGGRR